MDTNNKPYKGDDGKWKEADGSPYTSQPGRQHPWLDGKDFRSNKDNISTTGKGKTSLVSLAKTWKADGGSEVTKKQLQNIYKLMLGESKRNISHVANDMDAPLAVVALAESLLDPKTRAKTLADTQTWLFGKAPDAGEMDKVQNDFEFEQLTQEGKDAVLTLMKNNKDEYSETGS